MAWYAVRHVIKIGTSHEERITLWNRDSADDAIAAAEREAAEYAASPDWPEVFASPDAPQVLALFQSFELSEEPGDGRECFSLIRDSKLDPNAYVDTFFATGTEHEELT